MNYKKYGEAEEIDYAAVGCPEQHKAYEEFVLKVKEKFELKTIEEAREKAQKLIKDYHNIKDDERTF